MSTFSRCADGACACTVGRSLNDCFSIVDLLTFVDFLILSTSVVRLAKKIAISFKTAPSPVAALAARRSAVCVTSTAVVMIGAGDQLHFLLRKTCIFGGRNFVAFCNFFPVKKLWSVTSTSLFI